MMQKYHYLYPRYRFDRHKGYGTALHNKLLRQLGPSPIHRRSFAPVGALS
jgi:ribonuclease HII